MISDLDSRTRDRAPGLPPQIPRQPGEPAGLGDAESGAGGPEGSGLAAVPMMRGGRGRPTMKDVASRAGVALKTVSRVVNDEPGVTPETATRVRNAINELGFRRNDSARLLRKGQTASIGLIMEDIGDPFYSALSRAVEDVAHWNGSLLFAGSSDEDPQREQELALALCARRVDGLIVIPASGDHRYLLPEIAAGVASVFVDRPAGLIDADAVLADNVGGTRAGVAHLIRHGHRRIGFIGDAPHIYTAAQRQQGYRDAMTEAGLPVEPSWVSMAKPTQDSVRDALTGMLTGPAPVTALFCGNNRVTVLALRATAGRRMAVVGFDDFELADLVSPGVTVVAQNPAEMGRRAAELLFGRLTGTRGPAQYIELGTKLIVRGSGEIRPDLQDQAHDHGEDHDTRGGDGRDDDRAVGRGGGPPSPPDVILGPLREGTKHRRAAARVIVCLRHARHSSCSGTYRRRGRRQLTALS
jgi:LacI family transcriptional regulator